MSHLTQQQQQQQQQHSLAILDDYHSVAKPYFTDLNLASSGGFLKTIDNFPDTLHPLHSSQDHEDLITRLQPYSIISTMRERTPLPKSILTQLPNLRLLLTTGTRNLAISETACRDLGIDYAGTLAPRFGSRSRSGSGSGSGSGSVNVNDNDDEAEEIKKLKSSYSNTNEHTFALLLGLARNIAADDHNLKTNNSNNNNNNNQKLGAWQTRLIVSLAGKTIGLVGLGRLGAQAAITARLGFGMRVICWSENLTQNRADEVALSAGLPPGTFRVVGSKRELFETADVVSLHLVLGERSRGVVGTEELKAMKSSAMLVNTSRGPLVDELALLECVKRGGIRGVALDVFDKEPLDPTSPWRDPRWGQGGTSQVLLSPHMGYAEEDTIRDWYKQQAENLQRWLHGEDLVARILPKE